MQNTKVKTDKPRSRAGSIGFLHFDFCILQFDLPSPSRTDSRASETLTLRRRTPSPLGLAVWLIAVLVCQIAIADPAVQRATFTKDAVPAVKKDDGAQRVRKEPARIPDGSQPGNRPLPPRGAARSAAGEKPSGKDFKPTGSLATGLASLAIVLGLFMAAAWAVRRGMPAASTKLPSEVVEVLGRTPLGGRQFAHLIRCGNKLLLVHLAPGCAETLTEITDPLEVDRLAGLCRQAHPQSSTTSFRQVFQQFSREKK